MQLCDANAQTEAAGHERWRDIPGFEEMYQASTEGRVRSLPRLGGGTLRGVYRISGRMMKIRRAKGGAGKRGGDCAVTLNLFKDGVRYSQSLQVWVWSAFNGRLPAESEWVIHVDGDINNNRLENLRLGTQSDVGRMVYRKTGGPYARGLA
jgi:hypothetical protein